MLDLPISQSQTLKAVKWLKINFGAKIKQAVIGTPFKEENIYGIFCQETAYVWINWIDHVAPAVVLARCVFDASGDYPDTPRSAFPKKTEDFREKYGNANTDMLIHEANLTRAMRGYPPQKWVYKGYGIGQYDLQSIFTDEDFFLKKQWYSFDECIKRCMEELNEKYAIKKDVWASLKAYNGSGPKAVNYANNVTQFTEWARTV